MRNNPAKNKRAPVAASKLKIRGGFIQRKERERVKKCEISTMKKPEKIFGVFFLDSDGYTNDKKSINDKIKPWYKKCR